MGVTQFSKDKIESILKEKKIDSILDFGSQNDYSQPNLPAPYISEWYISNGIRYVCIDLCGENNSLVIDLAYPIKEDLGEFDLVVDCGTTEHVCIDSKFNWDAIYSAWLNKYNLSKIGGIIYSENPKTENWIGHGYNYYTKDFYIELVKLLDCELLDLGEHPACWNVTDGWNIFSTIKKLSNKFPLLEEFKKLDLRQS